MLQDTALGTQVPALIADAKDRLEVVAFTTGSGSAQPFGMITHGTSDATVGALTAAMVYGLHQALPPRFRVGDGSRPVWLANVTIINALRQIPSFAGSVTSLVNDNQPDSIPEVLSIDIYEDSAMDASNVVSGHKNLAILDMNSFVITNRQPELLLYEPLFKDQATGRPAGRPDGSPGPGPGRPDHGDRLPVPHHVTTRKAAAAMVAGNDTSLPLSPCGTCNGVDCGTPRVPVCCGSCTHT